MKVSPQVPPPHPAGSVSQQQGQAAESQAARSMAATAVPEDPESLPSRVDAIKVRLSAAGAVPDSAAIAEASELLLTLAEDSEELRDNIPHVQGLVATLAATDESKRFAPVIDALNNAGPSTVSPTHPVQDERQWVELADRLAQALQPPAGDAEPQTLAETSLEPTSAQQPANELENNADPRPDELSRSEPNATIAVTQEQATKTLKRVEGAVSGQSEPANTTPEGPVASTLDSVPAASGQGSGGGKSISPPAPPVADDPDPAGEPQRSDPATIAPTIAEQNVRFRLPQFAYSDNSMAELWVRQQEGTHGYAQARGVRPPTSFLAEEVEKLRPLLGSLGDDPGMIRSVARQLATVTYLLGTAESTPDQRLVAHALTMDRMARRLQPADAAQLEAMVADVRVGRWAGGDQVAHPWAGSVVAIMPAVAVNPATGEARITTKTARFQLGYQDQHAESVALEHKRLVDQAETYSSRAFASPEAIVASRFPKSLVEIAPQNFADMSAKDKGVAAEKVVNGVRDWQQWATKQLTSPKWLRTKGLDTRQTDFAAAVAAAIPEAALADRVSTANASGAFNQRLVTAAATAATSAIASAAASGDLAMARRNVATLSELVAFTVGSKVHSSHVRQLVKDLERQAGQGEIAALPDLAAELTKAHFPAASATPSERLPFLGGGSRSREWYVPRRPFDEAARVPAPVDWEDGAWWPASHAESIQLHRALASSTNPAHAAYRVALDALHRKVPGPSPQVGKVVETTTAWGQEIGEQMAPILAQVYSLAERPQLPLFMTLSLREVAESELAMAWNREPWLAEGADAASDSARREAVDAHYLPGWHEIRANAELTFRKLNSGFESLANFRTAIIHEYLHGLEKQIREAPVEAIAPRVVNELREVGVSPVTIRERFADLPATYDLTQCGLSEGRAVRYSSSLGPLSAAMTSDVTAQDLELILQRQAAVSKQRAKDLAAGDNFRVEYDLNARWIERAENVAAAVGLPIVPELLNLTMRNQEMSQALENQVPEWLHKALTIAMPEVDWEARGITLDALRTADCHYLENLPGYASHFAMDQLDIGVPMAPIHSAANLTPLWLRVGAASPQEFPGSTFLRQPDRPPVTAARSIEH